MKALFRGFFLRGGKKMLFVGAVFTFGLTLFMVSANVSNYVKPLALVPFILSLYYFIRDRERRRYNAVVRSPSDNKPRKED